MFLPSYLQHRALCQHFSLQVHFTLSRAMTGVFEFRWLVDFLSPYVIAESRLVIYPPQFSIFSATMNNTGVLLVNRSIQAPVWTPRILASVRTVSLDHPQVNTLVSRALILLLF